MSPGRLEDLPYEKRLELLIAKVEGISKDLTHNVTHIYGREQVVLAMDLVFHSVISFNFLGEIVRKGWLECLILGDTGCGKTSIAEALMRHYRAGELVRGEGATFAGLVGGAQQTSGGVWGLTWGTMVLQDRRLVVFDEVSGFSTKDISDMSGIRSDGIAQLTKIQQEKALARTRMIWISNPRSNRALFSYTAGIEAVRELIGRPEDVRRFDFALTVSNAEIDSKVINRRYGPSEVPHVYTSDLCHQRILWTWSRRPEHIVFTPEAEERILKRAEDLGKRYHPSIPLVEKADQRIKLARMAAAIAARVFSTDAEGIRLFIREEHAEFCYQYLLSCYDRKSLAYDLYSKQKFAEETLKDETIVTDILEIQGRDFVDSLLETAFVNIADIEILIEAERPEAKQVLSSLIKNRCLKKSRYGFFKSPAFIELLKKVKEEGKFITPKKEGEKEDNDQASF